MLRVARLLGRSHRSARLHPLPGRSSSIRVAKSVHEPRASVSNFEVNRRPQIDLPPNMRQSALNA